MANNGPDLPQRESREMPLRLAVSLGIYLIALAVLELVFLIGLWPDRPENTTVSNLRINDEQRLFILVTISGATGTTLTLLVLYVNLAAGQRLLNSSGWWFGLPPMIGALIGFIVCLGVRGGILKLSQSVDALNPYTVCALAAFAGLAWRQIVAKLQVVIPI